jgi:adenylate cyclase
VAELATTYGGRLGKAWRGRVERTSPQNFQAYDYFQRGIDVFNLFTKGCTATAIQWFEKAIERDPSYGKPYAKIAWAHLVDVWLGWSEDTEFSMAEALKFATAAIQHDDDEAWGYWAMAGYHMFGGHHDRAITAYQRALELNPNDADVLNDFGQCLSFAGRATEGVEVVHKAMRLNPHYPDYWIMQLGPIYFDARRYEDAISTLEKLHSKEIGIQLYLAASRAALGHTDQARATIASVISLDPLATLERLAPTFLSPYKNASDRDHLRENLIKAGLPE